MLKKLLSKKNLVVIGLNSGTSSDGLDLAAVRIDILSRKPVIRFIAGEMLSYPEKLHTQVNNAVNNRITSIDDIIKLDRNLGRFYGDRARLFIQNLKRKGISPDIVASHGQTVRHIPGQVPIHKGKESGTLQLGHPESIAEQTGLMTVADFRQADIAAGGEGAPITSYAMWLLFSHRREHRLMINIGGIANYFFFPKGKPADMMLAADCGPGNSLLDIISQRYFGRKYDSQGKFAAKGTISKRLLTILLADNYLQGKYGPSTGRERFGEGFVEKIMRVSSQLSSSKYDILATTTELTAIAVSRSITPHLEKYDISNVYLFGGGIKNEYLLSRLKVTLPNVKFFSVDNLGHNPDYLEAVCYAVMGAMAIHSLPAGLPKITGARRRAIAGRIVQPSRG